MLNRKHITMIATLLIVVGLWSLPIYAQMRRHGRSGGDGPNLFLLMRAAQMTADQKTQVHTIMQANFQNNKDLFTQLRTLRQQLNNSLFSTGTADTGVVSQINDLEGKLAQSRLSVFQQVWALLDSTQQSRVASVYAQLEALKTQRESIWKSTQQPTSAPTVTE